MDAVGTPDFLPDFLPDDISKFEPGLPYTLRHARVFSDNTFDSRQQAPETMSKLPTESLELSNGMNLTLAKAEFMRMIQALNNLQHSHQGQLLASSIDVPTRHWLDFIPPEAEGKINYPSPDQMELNDLFRRGDGTAWVTIMDNLLADRAEAQRVFGGFFEHEYTIFNWNTGYHWGTSLIHMRADNRGIFNRVAQIAVMDPMHDTGTASFVHARLRGVLERLGCSFIRNAKIERTFWLPRQQDGYSCGLVTAYTNRLLMERIANLYLPSGPKQYDEKAMWFPAREYFNPYEFQAELMGLVAVALMRETGYHGRITVAIIDAVTNYAVDADDILALEVGSDPTAFSLTAAGKPRAQRQQTKSRTDEILKDLQNAIKRILRLEKRTKKRSRPDDSTNDAGSGNGSNEVLLPESPTKKQKVATPTPTPTPTTVAAATATEPEPEAKPKGPKVNTTTTSSGKRVLKKPVSRKAAAELLRKRKGIS
ncbi:hypothetical protein PG996_007288 [Apiospora saccharicola]|uniref:Ubiquitin-like protease family profile domain-containing protein n=1 Tax=Apiospora saccharicola TaxID=335842 RepID=A0ABR1VAE8_9PEZI